MKKHNTIRYVHIDKSFYWSFVVVKQVGYWLGEMYFRVNKVLDATLHELKILVIAKQMKSVVRYYGGY